MATSDQLPVRIDILRRRGDTQKLRFRFKDAAGEPINLTNWSFVFTTDPSPEPPDDTTKVVQINGVIEDGPNGVVRIDFVDADVADVVEHFYDLQGEDPSNIIRTMAWGSWNLSQDIGKTT